MAFVASRDVAVGDATEETDHDELAANTDWCQQNLNKDHSAASSLATGAGGSHNMRVAEPMHVEVVSGTVWTLGFWQSADGRWWLLGNTADVTSFVRADADFYLPLGAIADVPT